MNEIQIHSLNKEKMNTTKNLGIWMDHSSANLMEDKDTITSHTIESDFTHTDKVDVLQKGESHMQNKEQQLHGAYYKEISNQILKYDHVLLFGPTNAKKELHNFLKKNLHFKDIKIDIEAADKMSNNEQIAFVRKHFEN
jgi:stalled ribosome rescue protein Dom34